MADASGNVQLGANLEPNMINLLRSFRALGGSQAGVLLDAAVFNNSLRAAPGIASSNLRNTGQERIEGTVGIRAVGDLLTAGADRFVTYQAPSGTSPGRLAIRLDRSIAPQVISQISPEAEDYLSALMAPVVTGESLSRVQYLQLVRSIYGGPLADEIAASRINAVITVPGTIRSARGAASHSGREARYSIPLVDLLVLEQPQEYEITW